MSEQPIPRHRTAIKRATLSRPVRLAIEHGLIKRGVSVFDYGCGLGDDLRRLKRKGIRCQGWDPHYRRKSEREPAQVVNIGYVVNVIEDPDERTETLRAAWGLAEQVLVVSARLSQDVDEDFGESFEDGRLTSTGTFQKFFQQSELRAWIDESLGVQSVPAAPGIFYAFRDPSERQAHLASRYRRQRRAAPKLRRSDQLFDQHRDLLEPLMDFFRDRGRLPYGHELEAWAEVVEALGSVKNAFRVVRQVSGDEGWDGISAERREDLLLYLALARFEGRPRFSQLPIDTQLDVRGLCSNYKQACADADALLYSLGKAGEIDAACRASKIGKQTPAALYVHRSALDQLAPLLRLFEGCARGYMGEVRDANLIKLHRRAPKVTYLAYPDFDRDPHPALNRAVTVHLQSFRVKVRRYAKSENPPILHRKEEFVTEDYPGRATFARLTAQEEKWDLYDQPERIGHREGWNERLTRAGVTLKGHRVVRA